MPVVDDLEAVEVDEAAGEPVAVALAACDLGPSLSSSAPGVRAPRQAVEAGPREASTRWIRNRSGKGRRSRRMHPRSTQCRAVRPPAARGSPHTARRRRASRAPSGSARRRPPVGPVPDPELVPPCGSNTARSACSAVASNLVLRPRDRDRAAVAAPGGHDPLARRLRGRSQQLTQRLRRRAHVGPEPQHDGGGIRAKGICEAIEHRRLHLLRVRHCTRAHRVLLSDSVRLSGGLGVGPASDRAPVLVVMRLAAQPPVAAARQVLPNPTLPGTQSSKTWRY